MGSLGIGEILLILLIFLLLFGAGRLPALAKGMGIALRKFRTEMRDDREKKDAGGDHP